VPQATGTPATGGAQETPIGTPATGSAQETPTGAPPAETGGQATGPKLNKDVSGTIEFWHFWGSPVRRNAIRRVVAICSKELPNIKVNETFKPFGDIWTANTAAVAAGTGMPDVIVSDRPKLPADAANNIYMSLQEMVDRDGVKPEWYWPFAWEQTLYEGQTYGIPYETEVRVLFYSKTAFKEAGLDPDKPPKTWAELEQVADKLDKKAADGSYERIAFFPLINVGPDVWGYTNDVEWVTKDGQPKVNDPKAVETLNWIKKWVDRYGGWDKISEFRAQFQAPPNDAFMSGKVAMIADINGYSSQLNFFRPQVTGPDGKKVNLEWGVSDLPYNTDKGSWSGGMSLSIPRGAKNVEPAWEFIKCATSVDAQVSWARDTYAIPGNQQAARDPELMADPNWQFFVDAMGYTTGGNYLKEYPNWGEQLSQRYEKVWRGELTAEQALNEAQQAIEAEVQKNR
jgi:multiple sugar transport system substrate-binding protein